MNKGYVPNRKPGANQVAASQNKAFTGCYLYVEGSSDCCFWRNFVDKKFVKIVACNGWEKVVDTVTKNRDKGNLCIGVVDLDFHAYVPEPDKVKSGIFITDDHDLEMMIYHSGDYQKVINLYDKKDKLQQYELGYHMQIIDEAKTIVGNIARLRMVVKKNNLNLRFRFAPKESYDFTYPNYIKILDKHTFTYKSDNDFIKYLIEWSKTKVSNVPSQIETEQLMAAEDVANYDEWKFLNGHDMTLILYILLKNKVKISISSEEDFERSLYVAYEKNSLEQTALYAEIQKFAQDNNIVIFK